MNKFLGNPNLKPTDFNEPKSGFNKIVVDTIHYGYQEMILEKDVPVKMSDGITLYVNIFRPNKKGKFPVVMSADAYGKDALSHFEAIRPKWPTINSFPTSVFTSLESPDPGYWVPNDYILIKVALRGSANSEGALHPWTMSEAKDYYDVVEWAGVQEWSNGNVGTNGVSYLAVTQWLLASLKPSHLKAMIPWEGLNDVYREVAFHGGIPNTGFYNSWAKGLEDRWPDREVDDMLEIQKNHPLFDEYWESNTPELSNIDVPMLVCASWSTIGLHSRGTFEGFKQAGSKDKWLVIHGRKEWEMYYRRESLELQKAFFDYFLKGIENDWRDNPKIRYELRDKFYQGIDKTADKWPIENTKYTKLYLNGKDKTLKEKKDIEENIASYNANIDNTRNNELRFRVKFNEDTEITGNMKLKLWVSVDDGDDMDLFVGIKKLDRRGEEVYLPDFNHIDNGQVSTGWLRVSHRELDEKKSTPDRPYLKHKNILKLSEGEVVPIEIEIWPSGTLFKKGESLELVIKGSEIITEDSGYKMVQRYKHENTVNKGTHKFYLGGKYDSYLLVPIIRK